MRFGPYFARTKAGDATHSHVGADMPPSAAAQNSLNTTLWQRALAACMSVVLAVSMTPSAALASDDATGADSAEPALSASDEESQDASADEASVAEEPVAQEVPADNAGASVVAQLPAAIEPSFAVAAYADFSDIATQSTVYIDSVAIVDAKDRTLSYASSPAAKVGDTIRVAAYQEDDYGDDEEITSSEYAQLRYQWYVGSNQYSTSSYTAIENATSRELKIAADLAGKYVYCRVFYGSNYKNTDSLAKAIEANSTTPETPQTEEQKTLAKIVAKAKSVTYNNGWRPNPTYGTDSNICDMLAAKIKEWGGYAGEDWSGVRVSLKKVEYNSTDPKQLGGISPEGDITYFFLSPADKTTNSDYSILRQFKPTYTLTLGDASVDYAADSYSTLGWDNGKVQSYLDELLSSADVPGSLTSGVASAETSSESLPSVLYANGKKVAEVAWLSSNSSAAKVSSSCDDSYNTVYSVAYVHGNTQQSATLTARATLVVPGYGNAPSTSLSKDYAVSVSKKSDAQIAAEKKELEDALAKITLTDYSTKETVDPSAVEADFTLPRVGKIGAGNAKISYSSSNSDVAKVNGYRVYVTRDIEGGTNQATITATLTRDGITATRDIAIDIKPIDEAEIDAAVSFMESVKAGYRNALLGDNASPDSVDKNLSPFREASQAEDGSITYSRAYENDTNNGIRAVDLPGYDSMAGTNWRTYKSSDPSIISDEMLRLKRPSADALVTVTSNLTYEKYESLAKAHPENAKLQSLVNQEVTATYRVVGTTDHSDPKIAVSFELVGEDADGFSQIWSDSTQQIAYGSTADALIEQALDVAGFEHTSYYAPDFYMLSDVTSPDGVKLGWNFDTKKYWQLFVNGQAASEYANHVSLNAGDSVVLYYSADGASLEDLDTANVSVSMSFIGPDVNGNIAVWMNNAKAKMPNGSTVADLTESLLSEAKQNGSVDDYLITGPSFYLSSITHAGVTYEWNNPVQGSYWQLFINGASSDKGADGVQLKAGMSVQWIYSGWDYNPSDDVIVDPGAARPNYDADWNGFGNGGNSTLVNVPTPGDAADLKWSVNLATESDKWVSIGDPIIVNGEMFVTSDSELIRIDANGAIVGRVKKGGTTSYFSRPVYADGLIICASDDGTIAAFTADTLTCVWKTKPLAASEKGRYQANSTMTVANGCVYAEFVAGAGATGQASAGAMVCVDIATGAVKWQNATVKGTDDFGAGYYWAGACASGNDLVIGDESGEVKLVDGSTGEVKSSAALVAANGSLVPCRATIVSAGIENGKETFLAVGREPATLFKVVRDGGSLQVVSSVEFGGTSTSTPAIANGKAFIGGNDSSKVGQLAVIDLATMSVEDVVKTEKYAEVKASPLASVQGDDTYVYFTANKRPGELYRYSVNDKSVTSIYTPSGSNANYCTASVIADADGNLYYSNDSGTVFALQGVEGCKVTLNFGDDTKVATPAKGKKMTRPNDPERDGYTFTGWYTDEACTQAYNFDTPVTAAFTLYAGWKQNPVVVPGGDDNGSGTNSGTNNGNGANNGGGNGSNGNGGSKGAGASNAGSVAPSATPISAASNEAAGDSADANAKSDESASSKDEKSSFDKATARSSSKAENDAATKSAAAVDDGASSTESAPIWPYIVLAVGVAGLAAAIVWFVVARRKRDGDE